MIKLKSFPIDRADEANSFMQEFPPRSTDKQSGIVFHNGTIVVIYDDGVINPKDREGKIRGEIEGDQSKLMLTQHSLEQARVALAEEKKMLTKLAPKGYETGMTDTQIRKLFNEYVTKETIEEFKDAVGPVENRIQNLENEILLDTHEVRRIEASIKGWQALLK